MIILMIILCFYNNCVFSYKYLFLIIDKYFINNFYVKTSVICKYHYFLSEFLCLIKINLIH